MRRTGARYARLADEYAALVAAMAAASSTSQCSWSTGSAAPVTKTGLIDRRAVILEIVRDAQPATVRQIFYLASVRGAVTKDESGYDRVQGDLLAMRREGQLPYGWIVDYTRWQRRPVTFDSIDEALSDTAATYRKALWRDADSYVEIWLEKDALSGVVLPVTKKFDVPLMVARG